MPRIRTLKPEFFRSPDTAKVSYEVRLFYQALWCWADDFGVGETNIHGLLGFAFCDEDGVSAQDVRGFCADVARAYGVVFYVVRGRRYYAIPSWDAHQKTERRQERRRYPAPDDPEAVPDKEFYDCADSAPLDRRNIGAESALEQGNRGTGEQGKTDSATAVAASDFEAWWKLYPRKVGKGQARKAYLAASKKTAPAELAIAAEAFATKVHDSRTEERFIPHPATWLNGERWADVAPEPDDTGPRVVTAANGTHYEVTW